MDMRFAAAAAAAAAAGCITRYVGGGCGLYDISMVDRMMLKFRPIAPKPVASGSGSGDSTAENGGVSINTGRGRGKRRYVRVKGDNKRKSDNKRRKVKKTSSFEDKEEVAKTSSFAENKEVASDVVTLSLMPETPDRKENSPVKKVSLSKSSSPIWLSFMNNYLTSREGHVKMERQKTVSFVTDERVTEMCVEGGGWVRIGWREMERDTCPWFISDGGDKVVYTNKAYKEMAGGGEEVEVVLVLVRNKDGKLPAAFTCNVKVTCRSGMSTSTLTVPCDAWRMEGGGYAWRLDVKAALSLGR